MNQRQDNQVVYVFLIVLVFMVILIVKLTSVNDLSRRQQRTIVQLQETVFLYQHDVEIRNRIPVGDEQIVH